MQELKEYAGDRAPVKASMPTSACGSGQQVVCRISTRGGSLRLAGTMAEVLGWLRGQCPGGKMCELSRLAEVRG